MQIPNSLVSQLFGVLVILVAGACVFGGIVRELGRYYRLERLAYCYPLGMTALAMPLFLLSLAGIHMSVMVVLLLVALAVVLVYAVRKLSPRKMFLQPADGDTPRQPLDEFDVFLILVIVACLGARLVASLLAPLNDIDGIAEWGLKAKILYYDTVKTTDYFQRADYGYSNQNYPLLWPMMYAWMCAAIGQWDDLGMLILNPLNLICFTVLLYFQAKRVTSRRVALGVTAIAASVPAAMHYAECAQSDIPLMLISGASFFCLYEWMRSRDFSSLMLAAFLMGGALFTKKEGIIIVVLHIAAAGLSVLVYSARTTWRRLFAQLAAYAAVAGLWALPWFWFERTHIVNWNAFTGKMGLHSIRWDELPAMMNMHVANWLHFYNSIRLPKWNLLWPLMLVTFLVSKSPRRHPGYCVLLIPVLQCAAFSLIYLAAGERIVMGSGMEFGTERETLLMLPPLWLLLALCAEEHWAVWRASRAAPAES